MCTPSNASLFYGKGTGAATRQARWMVMNTMMERDYGERERDLELGEFLFALGQSQWRRHVIPYVHGSKHANGVVYCKQSAGTNRAAADFKCLE